MKENIETTLQQNLSCSQSNVIEKVKKEDKMESEENKTKVEVKENTETTEKLVSANKEIEALKEQLRQNAISVYTEKATAKGVNTIDISKLTTEAISALTLQLDNIKVAEKVERKEVKEVAQPKTEDVKESVKSYDNFGGYVIESSDLGGIAFFKVN
jgi:predicted HAD superfamily phosphohydrolase